jgi:hypothetical protein
VALQIVGFDQCLVVGQAAEVDADLDALYALIKQFIQSKRPAKPRSLMATLRGIQIDAPPDFAANLDLYVSGEKRAEPDLH